MPPVVVSVVCCSGHWGGIVRRLNVSWNDIGASGGRALAELLARPCCDLTELDARDNRLGDPGGLCSALRAVAGEEAMQKLVRTFERRDMTRFILLLILPVFWDPYQYWLR